MRDSNPARVRFEGSQPILRVENMEASLRFYVDVLGFENAGWGNDDFTCGWRDRAGLYLCRGDQGRGGAWVWIGVEDIERLHQESKTHGVTIRLPPTNRPWAVEMQVEDPDGNVLRFGSEPKWGKVSKFQGFEVQSLEISIAGRRNRIGRSLEIAKGPMFWPWGWVARSSTSYFMWMVLPSGSSVPLTRTCLPSYCFSPSWRSMS